MNSANGGDVLFHFKGDTKDLDGKVSKLAPTIKGLGTLIGASVVAGTAVATGAVVKFVSDATKSFAEFEQLEGGLSAMLKGNADDIARVMDTSKRAYKDLQMSQNEYLTSFENSYAIVKNSISDTGDAIQTTNDMLQITADLYNSYGGDTEYYANAINWALKGTYSYLDNLNIGIVGTKEGFQAAAEKCGYLDKTVDQLTSDEKIDIIKQFAQESGAWGRSMDEASTTITGSLNMVKASWSDLINEFGKKDGDIAGAFDNLMSSADAFITNILPVLERVLDSVAQYLPQIIEKIGAMLPSLVQQLVPPIVQSAVAVFKALINALPQILTSLVDALPVIITALIEGLVQIVDALAENIDTLIPQIIEAILDIIPVLIENAPLFLEAGVKLLIGLTKGIINSIPVLVSSTKKVGIAMLNYLKSLPAETLKIGGMLIKGLWEGISNHVQWVVNKIKGMGNSILKAVKNIFGVHSPSTEFEFIGRMNMIGLQEGMEGLQPEIQKTIDSMFNLSPSLTGSMNNTLSPNIIVNNNVSMETDPLGQTVSRIKTFSGGAKNDYNYGMGV